MKYQKALGVFVGFSALQYFIVQVVVAAAWKTPFSLRFNYISDLGNTACGLYAGRSVCSPEHLLMNISFIILGLGMLAVAYFFHTQSALSNLVFLAGVGTLFVGFSPENISHILHIGGASLFFVLGNAALLVIDWKERRWIFAFGAIGILATVLLVSKIYLGFGAGGMERIAAYPVPIWMIYYGFSITKREPTRLAPAED